MIRPRRELKYLIHEAQAVAISECIRPFMRPDRHSISGEYSLVSLYLDSRDLRLCKESLDGLKSRYKLRIRSYSDAPEAPCFFEIKRRVNQVIVKSRACVPRQAVASLLSGGLRCLPGKGDDRRNIEQFLHYQQEIGAAPVMRVRYVRRAFESRFADDVRVTFDRRLSFNVTREAEVGLNGLGWQPLRGNLVVLEIKFTHGYPAWINDLVQRFGLEVQSMSKYARTVAQACATRYDGPAIGGGLHGVSAVLL